MPNDFDYIEFDRVLMTFAQAFQGLDVDWLEETFNDIYKHAPKSTNELPFALDRHPDDLLLVKRKAEFARALITCVKTQEALMRIGSKLAEFRHNFTIKSRDQ